MIIKNLQYDKDFGWLYIAIPDSKKNSLKVTVYDDSGETIEPVSQDYQKSATVDGYGAGGNLKLKAGYYYTYHGIKKDYITVTVKNITGQLIWAKADKYGLHGDEWTSY
ncbi:hypothetical protein [Lactovum odontotermitis]